MVKELDDILCKRVVKNLLQVGSPLIIGAFPNIFPNLSLIWLILAIVLYTGLMCRYAFLEKNQYDELEDMKTENLILQKKVNEQHILALRAAKVVATYKETIESYAVKLNNLSNSVKMSGGISIQQWDEINLYQQICKVCADSIKGLTGLESDVNVGYILNIVEEEEDSDEFKQYVQMVAHSNCTLDIPGVMSEKEIIQECQYYYAELIEENISEITVLASNQEIKEHFKKGHSSLDKYSQFIAIPVICPREKNKRKKIMGILQILVLNNKYITKEKEELRAFAYESLSQYATLILLVHKIKKSLISSDIYYKMKEKSENEKENNAQK